MWLQGRASDTIDTSAVIATVLSRQLLQLIGLYCAYIAVSNVCTTACTTAFKVTYVGVKCSTSTDLAKCNSCEL